MTKATTTNETKTNETVTDETETKTVTTRTGTKTRAKVKIRVTTKTRTCEAVQAWVGMDLGDRFTWTCVLDADGEVVSRERLSTTRGALTAWSRSWPGAKVAIETGVHARWIAEHLTELGHEVLVANARQLALISQNTRKSDEADAELLARALRLDPRMLAPVKAVLERDASALAVVRSRVPLVQTRTRLINHVRGTAKAWGYRVPSCSARAFTKRAAESLPPDLLMTMQASMVVIDTVSEQLDELDRTIAQLCEHAYPETQLLQSVPGVGPVTALYYVLVLANPHRFEKSRDVAAYLGLVPRRDQSGESDRSLRISKTGDSYLRQLLVSCAQYILGPFGKDSALRAWGLAKAAGGRLAKKRAVVAVARKLAVLLHRLWGRGQTFRPWPHGRPEPPTLVVHRSAMPCTAPA